MSETNLPPNWHIMTEDEKQAWLTKNAKAIRERSEKGTDIKVTVDTENIEQLITRNKELEEELEEKTTLAEDYESKLRLIAEVKLEKKRKAMGLDEINPETGEPWTPTELRAIEASRPKDSDKGAGRATLTSAQTGRGSNEGYESHEEMIADLRKRSHSDNPEERDEAQAIIDELWIRYLKGRKDKPHEVAKPLETGYSEEEDKKKLRRKGYAKRLVKGYYED